MKKHLLELPEDKDTVLILAGDLNNGGRCVANLLAIHKRFRYVLFVLGNHDYYGHNLNSVAAEITQLLNDGGTGGGLITINKDGEILMESFVSEMTVDETSYSFDYSEHFNLEKSGILKP